MVSSYGQYDAFVALISPLNPSGVIKAAAAARNRNARVCCGEFLEKALQLRTFSPGLSTNESSELDSVALQTYVHFFRKVYCRNKAFAFCFTLHSLQIE